MMVLAVKKIEGSSSFRRMISSLERTKRTSARRSIEIGNLGCSAVKCPTIFPMENHENTFPTSWKIGHGRSTCETKRTASLVRLPRWCEYGIRRPRKSSQRRSAIWSRMQIRQKLVPVNNNQVMIGSLFVCLPRLVGRVRDGFWPNMLSRSDPLGTGRSIGLFSEAFQVYGVSGSWVERIGNGKREDS